MNLNIWKYRFLRRLGRLTVRSAATLTFGKMPPMVSACAVVEKGGKFLMIRDTAQGRLVLPGGHLHWRESVEEGIRREVREETGYEVVTQGIVGAFTSHNGVADPGIVRLAYGGRISGGSERASPEGSVEWPDLDQLEQESSRELTVIRQWIKSARYEVDSGSSSSSSTSMSSSSSS